MQVELRGMCAEELGMAFSWMRADQRAYADATRWWDKAAECIQEAFEEDVPPVPAAAAAAAATTPARAGPRSRLAEVEAARRLVSCSPCRNYRLPAIEWPYSPTDCVCRIAGCRSGRPIAGGNSVKKRPATLMRPALE